MRTIKGKPLLLLSCYPDVGLGTIRNVYNLYPEAISIINKNYSRLEEVSGSLPLHNACRYGSRPGAIEFLIGKYPEALSIKSIGDHRTPLHHYLKGKNGTKVIDSGIVKIIGLNDIQIRCYEEDEDGKFPLHVAFESLRENGFMVSREVLMYLADESIRAGLPEKSSLTLHAHDVENETVQVIIRLMPYLEEFKFSCVRLDEGWMDLIAVIASSDSITKLELEGSSVFYPSRLPCLESLFETNRKIETLSFRYHGLSAREELLQILQKSLAKHPTTNISKLELEGFSLSESLLMDHLLSRPSSIVYLNMKSSFFFPSRLNIKNILNESNIQKLELSGKWERNLSRSRCIFNMSTVLPDIAKMPHLKALKIDFPKVSGDGTFTKISSFLASSSSNQRWKNFSLMCRIRKGKTLFSLLVTLFLSIILSTTIVASEVHSSSLTSTTKTTTMTTRRRNNININHDDVYLIITDPSNKLSQSVANQLYPATVYFVCPTTTSEESSKGIITKHHAAYFGGFLQRRLIQSLQSLHNWFQSLFSLTISTKTKRLRSQSNKHQQETTKIQFCYFDSNGGSSFQKIRQSVINCLHSIEENCSSSSSDEDNTTNDNTATTATKPSKMTLRGILFNPYGFPTTTNTKSQEQQQDLLLPLARYKVISIAMFIDVILQERLQKRLEEPRNNDDDDDDNNNPTKLQYSSRLRMIAVGSEAARGLPKMGFPVPYKLLVGDDDGGDTKQQKVCIVQDILSGKAFQNKTAGDEDPLSSSSSSSTSWESEYSHVCAIVVLYFKRLAALSVLESTNKLYNDDDEDYYGVVSPGMTEESLQVKHVPIEGRTIFFRMKMILCRTILFGWLRKLEIAKTVEDGASLLVHALMGPQAPQVEPEKTTTTTTKYGRGRNEGELQ